MFTLRFLVVNFTGCFGPQKPDTWIAIAQLGDKRLEFMPHDPSYRNIGICWDLKGGMDQRGVDLNSGFWKIGDFHTSPSESNYVCLRLWSHFFSYHDGEGAAYSERHTKHYIRKEFTPGSVWQGVKNWFGKQCDRASASMATIVDAPAVFPYELARLGLVNGHREWIEVTDAAYDTAFEESLLDCNYWNWLWSEPCAQVKEGDAEVPTYYAGMVRNDGLRFRYYMRLETVREHQNCVMDWRLANVERAVQY